MARLPDQTSRARRGRFRLPAVLTLFSFGLVSSGCLSHEYRVSRAELQRLADTPPEARGQQVRVLQRLGVRRAPAVTPGAPPGPGGPPREMLPPPDEGMVRDDVYVHGHGHVVIDVGGPSPHRMPPPPRGPAMAPPARAGAVVPSPSGGAVPARPVGAAPVGRAVPAPPARAGAAVPAKTSGGGGGLNLGAGLGGGGGGGGGGDELIVYAVIAIAVASMAAVGLAATEGLRFDGQAAVAPAQLVYLRQGDNERAVPLYSLSPSDLAGVDEGLLRDDEGYGLARLDRAPLDRKGFAFKVDLGGISADFDRDLVSGFASHIQLGVFPHRRFGLLAGASLAGLTDETGRRVARHALTAEAQFFPLSWRRLHLGAAGHVGTSLASPSADGSLWGGPTAGGGALLEIALTTRLALTARWDWSTRRITPGNWSPATSLAAGLAIY